MVQEFEVARAAAGVDPQLRRFSRMFWAFVVLHVVVWTITPLVCCPNAPLDSVEMVYWGREWQLGYPKHPPLVGWIAASIVTLTGPNVWGLYFAAQLAIAVCFWSAWRLGREVVGPRTAVLGVLALEGSFFLTYEGAVLNNNVGLYPCWALATLFFYWALRRERLAYWVACGACVGAGMLCKYSMAVLPATFALFVLLDARSRRWLRRPQPYAALAAGLAVAAPHIWWAAARGFPTVTYAASRTQDPSPLLGRLGHPLSFLVAEAAALAFVFLIALPLVGWRPKLRQVNPAERWDRNFVLAMTLGPFSLLLLASLVGNVHFRGMHGSHLWPFVGLAYLCGFELRWQREHGIPYRAALIGSLLVAAFAVRFTVAPQISGRAAREHFPGSRLAHSIDQAWRERYGCALPLVGGDSWIAGNVAFYSADRPRVYENDCDWLASEEFAQRGGVLFWNIADFGTNLPVEFKELGPCEVQPPLALENQSLTQAPPAQIGVAFIAPASAGPLDWLARSPASRDEQAAYREPASPREAASPRQSASRREPIIVAERVGAGGSRVR